MFSAVMYQLFAGKMASTSLPASQDTAAMTVEPPGTVSSPLLNEYL